MKRTEWNVSAGAVLLFALMYFFDGSGLVSAAVPAVCAHELGHLLPLLLCGHRLRRISVSLFGLELDYAGRLEGGAALFCIGGGPLAGTVYALLACSLGGAFWRISGAVSFLLTAFNLLPILPLDGGRLVGQLAGEAVTKYISRVFALLLFAAGVFAVMRFRTLSLLMMGAWLTVCNFRAEGDDSYGV